MLLNLPMHATPNDPGRGAAIWGVGAIYGNWPLGEGVVLLVYGTGIISTSDNIVRPLVLSSRVKLNTLLIFLSLLGGVRAFEIVGLFVGTIIISVSAAQVGMLCGTTCGMGAGAG